MNKTIFTLSLILISHFAWSQVTNVGEPKSWKNDVEISDPILMPDFDLEAVQREDEINDELHDVPWRFGYEHDVSYGLDNAGTWNELPNGDRVWLVNFKSEGANTLNFIFDDFHLPEGATLYFYNNDRSDLLGAYTSSQNREDMVFGSWLIDGDHVWVEYYEPKNANGQGRLNIDKVVHGYRSVADNKNMQKALNSSGACNHDVDCDVHDDFDEKKDMLKRSVALIVVGGNGFCSGTLINNTEDDETPYFLTANHCVGGSTASWAFRFNWVSNNPQCGTFSASGNGGFNQTLSGANVVASNSGSDFALLEITAPIQDSWNLVWAGWDRSTTPADYAVGIHHPSGDIMKVCREDDSPYMQNVQGIQVWFIDQWELGVTEGGSSGSALFNPAGRIIGQLLGGSAACSGTNDNGGVDFYGRFDVSWNSNSSNSRLRDWLDPNNTNVMTIDSHPPMETMSVNDVAALETSISIYPNPASNEAFIENSSSNAVNYHIFSITGKKVTSGKTNGTSTKIDISKLNSGIYLIQLEEAVTNQQTTKKLVVQ